jgi:16S rRNA (cytosine1402-N4)-methyltransferase
MHDPVLLSESISFLLTDPGGIYVDCTLGGGGHLNCLMEELNNEARVIAIDKDETAMNQTRSRFINKPNITFVYDDFKNLSHILSQNNVAAVDGILIDLGVSSFQLDESSRGFSYHNEATLDMRMVLNQELDAKYIVNHYSEQQLSQLILLMARKDLPVRLPVISPHIER